MYLNRINYLERIDTYLTKHQWYFRTRWHNVGLIRKSQPQQKGHLTLMRFNNAPVSFMYTTICKRMKEWTAPTDFEPERFEETLCLSLPRNVKDYIKTWGGVNYVICSYYSVKDKQMTYYYINAPRLLDYLSRALADETLWDGTVIPREVMHKDALRVSGLKQAGLIEMVDSVAMSGVIHVEDNTSPLATPEHFRTGYCRPINEWEKPPELGQDWSEFHLMSHIQDRSKSIVIVSVDTQREHSFKSLTEAARQLSSEGLLVHVSSISDCLKGRQATFKTTRGKCIVRYS